MAKRRPWPAELRKYERMAEEAILLASAAKHHADPFRNGFPKADPEDGSVLMPMTFITADIAYWVAAAEDCCPGTWQHLKNQVERHLEKKAA